MSYFVTGTDTGVGKTLVSCALLHAFAGQGKRVVGFKPVAAGCDDDGHNEDAKHLREAGTVRASYGQINPYCLPQPIAPHLSARHVGARIDFSRIFASYDELAGQSDEVIVEGVGGFCVPLNEKQDSVDLVKQLAIPVILVVGMRLGCLNHALLTMRAIADAQIECAGWVANVLHADMPALQENIDALRERILVPLLGVIPFQAQPDAREAAIHLNMSLFVRPESDA
ncbi:MAG: dethiobiotin synthase [Gallionella sp.]|nr:dethiobiotin synthase [Gallionella sp.]